MNGATNIRQGLASLARVRSAIKDLPIRVRAEVAKKAADVLNVELKSDFASGTTVYDTPRPLGVTGKPLSLVKTGATRSALEFVVVGTILRARLGAKYARYLVGKYQILPQSLPAAWRGKLEQIVHEYRAKFAREVGGAA